MSRIAIISDSHDQVANLAAAIRYCNEQNISTVIHCGDLISPFMLKQLTKLKGTVHLIYGNNMGDQHLISSRCGKTFENIQHHGTLAELELFNKHIAVVHYPEIARGLASQATYDIVCFGHNHTFETTQHGDTTLINPGQLMGEKEDTGFVVLNCNDMTVQRILVGESMFAKNVEVSTGSINKVA